MTIRSSVKIEKIVAITLITVFILYGLFEAYKFIIGPRIKIISPTNGETLNDSSVLINGMARNASFIYLNDRKIYVDENGSFSERLLLPQGYTIIKLSAEDRFKRKTEKYISLWRPVKEDSYQSINDFQNTKNITSTTTNATSTQKEEITN